MGRDFKPLPIKFVMANKNFGIYVHIPFCVSKCTYCSFISKCDGEENIQKYVNFLCDEICKNSHKYMHKTITSIYIGGGTPSFIKSEHIARILELIKQHYIVKNDAEISIECNPCSVTKQKLKDYINSGVNRISFGVQTTNNKLLKILGRKHTKQMARKAITMAKEVGFKNISADLMIGIPKQNSKQLLSSIKFLQNMDVTHISAYMLMLEEGTLLYNRVQDKILTIASDDECVDMYNSAVKLLDNLGYARYEISNFAKQGYKCKHNQNYWQMGEYIGFGVAAHSFVDNCRFANADSFDDYYKGINLSENLSNKEIIEELIMLGLRTQKGVCIKALNDLGYDILKEKKQVIKTLKKNKIISINNGYITLTSKNFGLCSAVVLELI